jgi:hypothetical protein
MSADFAVHPELFSDLIECVGIPSRAMYAISKLDEWMADEERDNRPPPVRHGRAFVRHQPKA